jgi:hypothetical protein
MSTVPKLQDASLADQKVNFDKAVETIQMAGIAKPNRSQRRNIPIMSRIDEQSRQKRAVKDAARALAQLWDLSPHPVR